MEAAPLIDSIFTAALMAGGSQPLHSLVDQIRKEIKRAHSNQAIYFSRVGQPSIFRNYPLAEKY